MWFFRNDYKLTIKVDLLGINFQIKLIHFFFYELN